MIKKDKYQKARGGYSRILQLACASCGQELCKYQKDGPGIIKRLYVDRITGITSMPEKLTCSKCKEILAVKTIYKKENRPAYRVYVGAISKKIIKSNN